MLIVTHYFKPIPAEKFDNKANNEHCPTYYNCTLNSFHKRHLVACMGATVFLPSPHCCK